jgi:RimJ/RimL family protein N-acetyltransferase
METDRLILRKFTLSDAAFVLELLNSPNWLEFIGDKGVRTVEDAEAYLQNGSLKSYAENGFGFYAVVEKSSGTTIGMCGLIKRDSLEDTDIGYAFLQQHTGKGLGTEAAAATVAYALHALNFNRLIAIVNPKNIHSVNILAKVGMRFEQMISFENQPEPLALYAIEK